MTVQITKPFEKQLEFIEAFFKDEYRYLLYGGAIRGGKSYLGVIILVMLCKLFPNSRHIIMRKDYPSLKRNVIPVCAKVIPSKFLHNFNKTDLIYKFTNGSEIMLIAESYEDDPELDKFRGLEFNTALLEEVNELREKTYWAVVERCGAWMPPVGDRKSISKVIGTCNPDQGYIKQMYYIPYKNGTLKAPYYYLPAKITDNPHIDKEYLDSLKDLPEEIYSVFVEGSWEAMDNIYQMVSWTVINRCREVLADVNSEVSIGCDVGREGPDATVLVVLRGGNVIDIIKRSRTDMVEVADLIQEQMVIHACRADMITVDSVGVGGGVIDILAHREIYVTPMIAGATKISISGGIEYDLKDLTENSHFNFKNWKAYNYWTTAQRMKEGRIGNFTHETLQSDASAVWYFTPDDKTIQVESKDNMKKRIGRSPDYWDAFCYAVWGSVAMELIGENTMVTMSQFTKSKKAA